MKLKEVKTGKTYILTERVAYSKFFEKDQKVKVRKIASDNTIAVYPISKGPSDYVWIKANQLKVDNNTPNYVDIVLKAILPADDYTIISSTKKLDCLSFDAEDLVRLIADKITIDDFKKMAVLNNTSEEEKANEACKVNQEDGLDLDDLEEGMIIVPFQNTNGHNYEIGEPVTIVEIEHDSSERTVRARKENGEIGNHLKVADCKLPDCDLTTSRALFRQILSEDGNAVIDRLKNGNKLTLNATYINNALAKVVQPEMIVEAITTLSCKNPS